MGAKRPLTHSSPPVLPPPQTSDGSAKTPMDNAVLLPPQTFDGSAKAPNTTRERYGQWSITGGGYLIQPVFESNPAFVVNRSGGNSARPRGFSHHPAGPP